MPKKIRFAIATTIILGAFGFLIFSGISQGTGRFLLIEEALAIEDKENLLIQMEGTVDYQTVDYNLLKPQLSFEITDGVNNIPVIFNDVKPDNFDLGYPIIVEGTFGKNEVFIADKLLVKCPSKYEEATN